MYPSKRSASVGCRGILLAALLVCLAPPLVFAEHRVALLIGNSQYNDQDLNPAARNLDDLAEALENYGVRSTIQRDLADERQLREANENFADNTPTASTAIVYFAGIATKGKHNGKQALVLVGTDSRKDRGYPLNRLLESLSQRGGSRLNLIILDSPETPEFKHDPPDETLIAFHDLPTLLKNLNGGGEMLAALREGSPFHESTIGSRVTVTGKGNDVISPPDKFVLGTKAGDEWVDRRGAVFVWCPAGRYIKGSPESEPGRFSDETQEALEECLKKLPEADRVLLDRRYVEEDSTLQELAEESGQTANVLYKALGRIRRQLLECINRKLASDAI
jgi:hypothetical protein